MVRIYGGNCNGDDFELRALLYLKPIKRFECGSDVKIRRHAGDCARARGLLIFVEDVLVGWQVVHVRVHWDSRVVNERERCKWWHGSGVKSMLCRVWRRSRLW